jgi:hypothetical protein
MMVSAPQRSDQTIFSTSSDHRRSQRRIAKIAVDFHPEVAANDHRFQFGMIDVGWQNGAATGDLVAHELRGEGIGKSRAEIFAAMLTQQTPVARIVAQLLQAHGFTQSDVFHLRRDDATAGVVHLSNARAGFGAARRADVFKTQMSGGRISRAGAAILGRWASQYFRIVTLPDPGSSNRRQAFEQINLCLRIGVGTGTVVDRDRWIVFSAEFGRGGVLADFAQRNPQIRTRSLDINFTGVGVRAGNTFAQLRGGVQKIVRNSVHAGRPRRRWMRTKQRRWHER